MERTKKGTLTKYLLLKDLTPNQISTEMRDVLGDDAPSQATIYGRVAEFNEVDSRLKTSTVLDALLTCSDDNVQSVQDMTQ